MYIDDAVGIAANNGTRHTVGDDIMLAGLFAGVGGFELAFSQAGFHARTLAEIDPSAQHVLHMRFPEASVHGDVSTLDRLGADVDVLTAGFPCQNLSMAGDKSGITGAKSSVVEHMFGLIRSSFVPVVVIENVYFLLQLDSGRGMERLVEQLEELGYYWAYRVLNTIGFGIPHRRRRVYLVAMRDKDPREVLFADESEPLRESVPTIDRPIGFYWTEGRSGVGLTSDGIPPLKVGSGIGIPSTPAVLFPDGEVLTPSLTACERLQGFPPGWISATDVGADRAAWRMIGNSVSVPVARWVACRIQSPGSVLDLNPRPFTGTKWPDAAWCVGGGRFAVSASDTPISVPRPSINEFRDESWARLSERALKGFIDRAVAGRLKMPTGFIEALRRAPRRLTLTVASR